MMYFLHASDRELCGLGRGVEALTGLFFFTPQKRAAPAA